MNLSTTTQATQAANAFRYYEDDAHLFTVDMRDAIEDLRAQLAQEIRWSAETTYGATEDGAHHWAVLGTDVLPQGSTGHPGALVTIAVGPGIPGFSVVISADGRSVLHEADTAAGFSEALKVANTAAVREFNTRTSGAFHGAV